MKEITPEIKKRILALYWGQEVLRWKPTYGSHRIGKVGEPLMGHLYLTPLSKITDEDAIEVGRLNGIKTDNPLLVGKSLAYWLGKDKGRRDVIFEVADFLRSRGYALPAFGHSVDDLVKAGVFKLKPNPAKTQ